MLNAPCRSRTDDLGVTDIVPCLVFQTSRVGSPGTRRADEPRRRKSSCRSARRRASWFVNHHGPLGRNRTCTMRLRTPLLDPSSGERGQDVDCQRTRCERQCRTPRSVESRRGSGPGRLSAADARESSPRSCLQNGGPERVSLRGEPSDRPRYFEGPHYSCRWRSQIESGSPRTQGRSHSFKQNNSDERLTILFVCAIKNGSCPRS